MQDTLHCAELGPERQADYLHFFDHRAFTDNPRWAGCYCYFPLHDPDKIDWQQRGAAENREAICGCIAGGQAQGVLAYRGSEVVGWCSAGPWAMYPMLQEDGTPPDADSLGVVFCFVVAPAERGKGVATALLEAACAALQRRGMKAVQAKPLKDAEGPAANHLGPLSMYQRAGFQIVGESPDGDIFVRKSLV